MNSLYLRPDTWDLDIDSSRNIATAQNPYAIAQNAASAIKCFKRDCYYDQDKGIPYYLRVLGEIPSMQYLKTQFVKAALEVHDVVSAKCFITGIQDRVVMGQVQVTDINEITLAANF